jgi:hypothetical protein
MYKTTLKVFYFQFNFSQRQYQLQASSPVFNRV